MSEKKLTYKQKKGLEAILGSSSISQASQQSGFSERQLYRWLDLPHFREELSRLQGEMVANVARRLTFLAGEAVEELPDLLKHPYQKGASNKRLTILSILEYALKYREAQEIDERLTALERKVFNNGK